MIRQPAVAGQFYPGTGEKLRAEVARLTPARPSPAPALLVVAPHAGYVYSGGVAGEVYSTVEVPRTVVVFGPNHTGAGARFSLWPGGSWRLPVGDVPVEESLVRRILAAAPIYRADTRAHLNEHGAEVHLPFLLHRRPDVQVVCGVIGSLSWTDLQTAARGLHQAIVAHGEPVLLVASSDFTHYESQSAAQEKDRLAIDRILALDPEGLLQTVSRHEISMCGIAPTVLLLTVARLAGAKSAALVKYATSGDVSGDYDSVVGYAGIAVRG